MTTPTYRIPSFAARGDIIITRGGIRFTIDKIDSKDDILTEEGAWFTRSGVCYDEEEDHECIDFISKSNRCVPLPPPPVGGTARSGPTSTGKPALPRHIALALSQSCQCRQCLNVLILALKQEYDAPELTGPHKDETADRINSIYRAWQE